MQNKSPPHANPRALSRLIAAPLQIRPPETGAPLLREPRGKEALFPFPPGASRGGESSPHACNTGRLPPQEGFQNAPLKTPLRDPPGAHPGESVQSKTMRAAKQESEVFPLAAFCLLAENPHLGHRLPTAALHRGFTPVNSNTATRFQAFLYDSGRRSRSTGKERDAETGLDYFGARYLSSTEGRFASTDPIYLMPQKLMDPQQWNLYAYVRNNPLRFLDPTGMYLASCGDGVKGCDKQVTKLDSAIQTALKSNNSDVVKAAQAYGKLGDDNGVNVTIVKVVDPKHPDVTGKVTEQAGTGGFTVDPATGQVKQATQVSIRAGMGSSQLEETAVHEGQHVLDRANFVNSISNGSQFNRLLNITGRQSERNAYGVENEWLGLHGQPARNIDEILSRPPYSDSPTIDMPLFPAIPGAQP